MKTKDDARAASRAPTRVARRASPSPSRVAARRAPPRAHCDDAIIAVERREVRRARRARASHARNA